MSKDILPRCARNADVPRGPVKHLICTPQCPHYAQCLKNEGQMKGKLARKYRQRMARTRGDYDNCPNPDL